MSTSNGATGQGGASQGAAPADLSEGQSGVAGAPAAPVIPGKPNKGAMEGLDEDHGGEGSPEPKKAADAPPEGTEPADEGTPEPEKGSEDWHKQFIQTGNEHADAAIDVMKEAGVSPIEANAVFQKAIESGNLEDINWNILEDKIGKSKAALVKAGVEKFYEGEYKARVETVNKAHEIVGGKENWEKVRDWAQKAEKKDPALKAKVDNIRKAIDIGGDTAAWAVGELKRMYEAAPSNKGLGTKQVVQGSRTAPQADASALSRSAYMAERHKLAEAGVHEGDPRVTALAARRAAGRAAGI